MLPLLSGRKQPAAAKLAVLYVIFGYYAFTHQRLPSGAMQKVAGYWPHHSGVLV